MICRLRNWQQKNSFNYHFSYTLILSLSSSEEKKNQPRWAWPLQIHVHVQNLHDSLACFLLLFFLNNHNIDMCNYHPNTQILIQLFVQLKGGEAFSRKIHSNSFIRFALKLIVRKKNVNFERKFNKNNIVCMCWSWTVTVYYGWGLSVCWCRLTVGMTLNMLSSTWYWHVHESGTWLIFCRKNKWEASCTHECSVRNGNAKDEQGEISIRFEDKVTMYLVWYRVETVESRRI